MMYYNYPAMWWGGGGILLMILFWVIIIVAIVSIIRFSMRSHYHGYWHRMYNGDKMENNEDSAVRILRERLAKGEIDQKEFEDKMKLLKM